MRCVLWFFTLSTRKKSMLIRVLKSAWSYTVVKIS